MSLHEITLYLEEDQRQRERAEQSQTEEQSLRKEQRPLGPASSAIPPSPLCRTCGIRTTSRIVDPWNENGNAGRVITDVKTAGSSVPGPTIMGYLTIIPTITVVSRAGGHALALQHESRSVSGRGSLTFRHLDPTPLGPISCISPLAMAEYPIILVSTIANQSSLVSSFFL
jgi:hypothetical protein